MELGELIETLIDGVEIGGDTLESLLGTRELEVEVRKVGEDLAGLAVVDAFAEQLWLATARLRLLFWGSRSGL